jgi:hypothetical protein
MSLIVKTVFESDTSLRNYREKTEEIRLDVCMSACVSLHQVDQPARGKVFMRKQTDFDSLNHWFLYIVVTKNVCTQSNLSFYASDLLGLDESPHSRALGWLGLPIVICSPGL